MTTITYLKEIIMDIEEIKAFLSTDEGKALVESSEVTHGLKTKRDELLSKNVSLTQQLKTYSDLGDPELIAKAIKKLNKNKEKPDDVIDDKVDTKLSAELAHLRGELEKEREIRTKREQGMVASYVDAEIITAIAKHKGVPELLKHIVSSRVKGELKEDGSIGFNVLNDDGTAMFKGGKEASIEDLMSEIKNNKIYGRAFDADVTQGAGTRPSGKVNNKVVDFNDPSFNLTEAMRNKSLKR